VEGYSPQMARLRRLAVVPSTLLVGLLVGFVVTAFVMPLLPGDTQPGNRQEPPETRGYINALLNRDGATINKLQLPRNVVNRASVLKQFEEALALPGKTLTFLGGSRVGPIGQFGYVLTVDAGQGTSRAIPILLTTVDNKIWYLRGGSTGEEAPPAAPAPSAQAMVP
jgi:hypothetical protein